MSDVVVVVCYLTKTGYIGCVGAFDPDVDIVDVIREHAKLHNLNPHVDYTTFRCPVQF